MNSARGRNTKLWLGIALLGCLVPFSAAWASAVNISSMLVDNASLTVSVTGYGSYSFSGPVIPPADILMGEYQPSIYTANITTSGATGTATLYSAGAIGNPVPPPPSGTVDVSKANPVYVNFSSFRLSVNINSLLGSISFDAPAWPITTPNSSSTFDALTNAYTLGWNNNFSVTANFDGAPLPLSGNIQVSLAGTLQPVPIPSALWLFGCGLIGIAALAYRGRSAPGSRRAA